MPLAPMSADPGIDLGRVVRPFGFVDAKPTRLRSERGLKFGSTSFVAPTTTTEEDNVGVLRWSASQSSAIVSLGSMGFTIKWPDDDDFNYTELARDTHVILVENPDDSSQYVDVEVVDNFTVQNRKGIQSNFKFENE